MGDPLWRCANPTGEPRPGSPNFPEARPRGTAHGRWWLHLDNRQVTLVMTLSLAKWTKEKMIFLHPSQSGNHAHHPHTVDGLTVRPADPWVVGKKGKLSPRYVGPYRILKRIGKVAYELEFPADLAAVHPVFHISLLKKCVGDPASIVPLESVAMKDSLSYEDVPVEILDCQVQVLSIQITLRSVPDLQFSSISAFHCPFTGPSSRLSPRTVVRTTAREFVRGLHVVEFSFSSSNPK
ncbi:hypothetical protein MTR67_022711 [Solanum verrucosum]|uniref:Tf2-1-like SH3-like domain-containing protein n=1 Tax=Solanum verrucosum TaxID=315347 RepID=A0AAF0QTV2_SOLVR|nr:hypothetical protein MTR67_022711 [Solanum verrucosum]